MNTLSFLSDLEEQVLRRSKQ